MGIRGGDEEEGREGNMRKYEVERKKRISTFKVREGGREGEKEREVIREVGKAAG